MTIKFHVKTRPGQVHVLNGRSYRVVKVIRENKKGWLVEIVKAQR